MYIKSLQLTNFQSHKNTKIEFTNGLNAIIGASNAGKSSCVRALRFVLCNEQIEDFITQGEKNCEVTVEFDNGTRIVRGRKSKDNYYTILKSDSESETFNNFGREIPLKVKELTCAVELTVDEDKSLMLNIIGQHNPYFLLGETDSLKNKAINSLADVHYIDSAIRDIKNDTDKETKTCEQIASDIDKLNNCEELKIDTEKDKIEIQDIENEIHKYEGISETLKNIIILKQKYNTIETKETNLQNIPQLQNVLTLVNSFRMGVDRLKELIKTSKAWISIENKENALNLKVAKLYGFNSDLVKHFSLSIQNLKKLNELLAKANASELKQTQYELKYAKLKDLDKTDIENYEFQIENWKSYNNLLSKLNNFNSRFLMNKHNMDNLKIEIETTKTDYVNALVSMNICPLCKTPLDEHKLREVVGQI